MDVDVDVVVEVGDWEHECCGPAYERGQVVDLTCMVVTTREGATVLVETRHEIGVQWPVEHVRGRVVDLEVVQADGTTLEILRVPDGSALCGFGEDDGHLEDPWTGEVVLSSRNEFWVTVRVPGSQVPGAPSPYRTLGPPVALDGHTGTVAPDPPGGYPRVVGYPAPGAFAPRFAEIAGLSR